MARMRADVTVHLTVEFEDNGEDDLKDQAYDAARDIVGDADMEVVGEITEVEGFRPRKES